MQMKCSVERLRHGEGHLISSSGWPDFTQKAFRELEQLCLSFGLKSVRLEFQDNAPPQDALCVNSHRQQATLHLAWPNKGSVMLSITPATQQTSLTQQTLHGIQQTFQHLINQHAQTQQEARQAQRWQQALYNSFAVWDWEGSTRRLFCSEEWTNLLGLPHDTIRSVRMMLKRIHPEDRPVFKNTLKKLFDGSVSKLDCEIRFKHAWEDYIWLRTRARVTDCTDKGTAQRVIGTSVNITARKKAEEEIYDLCQQLHNSEVLYRELMKNASDAILIVDKQDDRIIDANLHASDLSGYSMKELMGMERCQLLKNPDGGSIPCQDKGLIRDMLLISRHGQQHIVDISCTTVHVSGRHLAQCIIHDVSEHKAIEKRLQHLAHHDPLTGLPNRILFRDRLQHALHKAQRNNTLLALCFFDLDHFKSINDSFGHDAGDRVLTCIAERLEKTIRASDTAARLAGDEFVVILEDLEHQDLIQPIASKILSRINQPITVARQQVRVTSSLGISLYPLDTLDSDTLLNQADTAMYRAKKNGSGLEFYTISEDLDQESLDLWPITQKRSE